MMPDTTVRSDLQSAIVLHQSGQLKEATTIYKQVLDTDPANGDALHLLGLVSHQSGQSETAIALIKRALEVSPDHPDFLRNLANILRESGQFKEAIQRDAESNEARYGLGKALHGMERYKEAAEAYLAQHPSDLEIRFDVISIIISKEQTKIEHFTNAF